MRAGQKSVRDSIVHCWRFIRFKILVTRRDSELIFKQRKFAMLSHHNHNLDFFFVSQVKMLAAQNSNLPGRVVGNPCTAANFDPFL